MIQSIGTHHHSVVIIPEPTSTIIFLYRVWRRFRKLPVNSVSEQQKQEQLPNVTPEIVATFYSEKGYMLTMRRIHRKMLHLASGGVVEGFVTTYDKHFSSVTTDAFKAELKAIDVYLKDYTDNRNYHLKKCWQVVPTIEALQDDERVG